VTLSGIDDLNNNSIENAFRERPSAGKSLEATLVNKSALELLSLGMELMLNAKNFVSNSIPQFGNFSDVVTSSVWSFLHV
jgi:hypothetical protein